MARAHIHVGIFDVIAARRYSQRGAVLIFGMLVLLVVSIIGISGQQGTLLQERMAGNMRQNNIALQAAEAALQAGLSYVEEAHPISPTPSGTEHVWPSCSVADAKDSASEGADNACVRLDRVLTNWRGPLAGISAGVAYDDLDLDAGLPGVIAQPRVYIELRKEVESPDTEANSRGELISFYYTVTSIGFGGTDKARAILQATVAKAKY
jgi:type IV pilus assembly protein PilX